MGVELTWPSREVVEPLASRAVHVWAAPLDVTPARLVELRATLSPDEQERAARFGSELLTARFVASRGQLRELLSEYLGAAPSEIRFAYSTRGKPSVLAPNSPIRLSVSHSGDVALYAFSAFSEVGVDVEAAVAFDAMSGIASRYFSAAERAALAAASRSTYTTAFYSCWTRKEAYLKARGIGLNEPLDGFDVSMRPGDRAALLRVAGDASAPSRWSLAHLEPARGYIGALAVETHALLVNCWTFER